MWSLSPDGRCVAVMGGALEAIGLSPTDFIGKALAELPGASTDLDALQVIQRAMAGQAVCACVAWLGRLWLIEAGPAADGGAIGLSHIVVRDDRETEPVPCLGFDVYECTGDDAKLDVWSADRWYVPTNPQQPGVFQIRYRMRTDFEAYRSAHPDRAHLISQSPRPRPPLRLI